MQGLSRGAVLVVLIAATAAAGLYINSKMDKIFPNVTVGGVNLSGMTSEQAKIALTDAGYDKKRRQPSPSPSISRTAAR